LLFLRIEFEVTVVAGGLTVVAGELSYLTFLYKFTIFLYGVYVNWNPSWKKLKKIETWCDYWCGFFFGFLRKDEKREPFLGWRKKKGWNGWVWILNSRRNEVEKWKKMEKKKSTPTPPPLCWWNVRGKSWVLVSWKRLLRLKKCYKEGRKRERDWGGESQF
jgi:hypothetical protein